MIKVTFTLILSFIYGVASAVSLPHSNPVPGGIAVVNLDNHDTTVPVVKYNGNRVLVMRNERDWYAIVGIPLTVKPGNYSLIASTTTTPIKFIVNDKQYKTQRITIKDKRKVEPNKEDLKRISRETRRINDAFSFWSDRTVTTLGFLMPVSGKLGSPFEANPAGSTTVGSPE